MTGGGGQESQHHRVDALRMDLGVSQSEGGSPRQPQDGPAFDTLYPAQRLDVADEVMGGIRGKIDIKLVGERQAVPGLALVEQNDPVCLRVKEAPLARSAARSRSTVEEERRLAIGVAAALPVHPVSVTDFQHATVVRFNGWNLAPISYPFITDYQATLTPVSLCPEGPGGPPCRDEHR